VPVRTFNLKLKDSFGSAELGSALPCADSIIVSSGKS
jgi:hypothetical protein